MFDMDACNLLVCTHKHTNVHTHTHSLLKKEVRVEANDSSPKYSAAVHDAKYGSGSSLSPVCDVCSRVCSASVSLSLGLALCLRIVRARAHTHTHNLHSHAHTLYSLSTFFILPLSLRHDRTLAQELSRTRVHVYKRSVSCARTHTQTNTHGRTHTHIHTSCQRHHRCKGCVTCTRTMLASATSSIP